MASPQRNLQCSPTEPLQSDSETQGLEAAQSPEAVEEACFSSEPTTPDILKEAAAAYSPSTPESPQSSCSSSTVSTATSSSKSSEGSSSQEEEASTSEASTSEASPSVASTSEASTSVASTSEASTWDTSTSEASTWEASPSEASISGASTLVTSTSEASASEASASEASTSVASPSEASPSEASPSESSPSAASPSVASPSVARASAVSTPEASTSEEGPDPRNALVDALEDRVTLLVDTMLVKYRAKEPITKEEMLTIVSEEYQDHFTDLFLQASERMEIIYGLDVKEVDPIHHCYAIVIKLGLTYDGMLHGEKDVPKTGILILLLGAIFMKGNRATEEEVWKILNVMNVYRGQKHDIFGDATCLITKHFLEEEYLKYQQVANSDPAQFEFLWGPRAHAETTKMEVLKYLAKVYGSDPRSFTSQYEEAFQEEQERSQARNATAAVDSHGHFQF